MKRFVLLFVALLACQAEWRHVVDLCKRDVVDGGLL